jgi:hypothetical protein
MPNRILRDWTDSKRMDSLSFQEEVLFTRLIMKADDYGNYHRDPALIRSLLFPRKDGLRSADIDRWLTRLEAAGLIRTYPAKGDTFLHIVNFSQRLRQQRRSFPEPPETIDSDLTASCQQHDDNQPPETKRSRNEVEVETKEREAQAPPAQKFSKPSIYELENFFVEKGLDEFTAKAQAKLFINYYESNGWKVGKNSMRSWPAAAGGWKERMNQYNNSKNGTNRQTNSGARANSKTAGANRLAEDLLEDIRPHS